MDDFVLWFEGALWYVDPDSWEAVRAAGDTEDVDEASEVLWGVLRGVKRDEPGFGAVLRWVEENVYRRFGAVAEDAALALLVRDRLPSGVVEALLAPFRENGFDFEERTVVW